MKILILQDDINRINIFNKKLKNEYNTINITDRAGQAIQYLKNNKYDYCFLDHDLGGLQMQWNEQDCGMVVVDYLCKTKINIDTMICVVHSYNNVRGPIMAQKLQSVGYKATYHPGVWNALK